MESSTPYMNTEQAAEYVVVSVHTMRQWISRKKIPFIKIPNSNRVLLKKNDLDEWLHQGYHGASIAAEK
jgi:excisionase family DNA binding protein